MRLGGLESRLNEASADDSFRFPSGSAQLKQKYLPYAASDAANTNPAKLPANSSDAVPPSARSSTVVARHPPLNPSFPATTATIATERTPGVVAYMAAHDRVPAPVEEVEYEYARLAPRFPMMVLLILPSYESLPPNYSLTANMLAGAFAGIAVRRRTHATTMERANAELI